MSETIELVDLSLFAESPTNDDTFSTAQSARVHFYDDPREIPYPRYRSHTLPSNYTNKPLPPLPQRRLRPRPRISTTRCCDGDSRCILKRIQRIGSDHQSCGQRDSLLQRRNPLSPPALTLSVPQSSSWNGNPASTMIWMPDEQMWLIAGEYQHDHAHVADDGTTDPPPAYTPRSSTRSEPSPSILPPVDLTPPLTPIQYQFQSLIQQPSRVPDEQRFSPLFQEAMNSVPMVDPDELFLPSLTVNTNVNPDRNPPVQISRPQSLLQRSVSDVSSQSTQRLSAPLRSVSAYSRTSHTRSDSSDSRSYYTAMSDDLTQPAHSANRWASLARRVASPDLP